MGGEAGDVATEPSPDETEAAADETCDFANSANSADSAENKTKQTCWASPEKTDTEFMLFIT